MKSYLKAVAEFVISFIVAVAIQFILDRRNFSYANVESTAFAMLIIGLLIEKYEVRRLDAEAADEDEEETQGVPQ